MPLEAMQTVARAPRTERGGNLAAKTGMAIEHAAALLDTRDYHAEQAASDAERFAADMSDAFLDWRAGQWDLRHPMPPRMEPESDEWVEYELRREAARRRLYEPLTQELWDLNGGNPPDHGTLLGDFDE